MATSTITLKTDTTVNWTTSKRVLDANELGLELTADGHRILRIGDGETEFMKLPVSVDIEETRQIKTDMEKAAAQQIVDMEKKGQELIDEMVQHEGTVVLTDDETDAKYRMGFSAGMPYFEIIKS